MKSLIILLVALVLSACATDSESLVSDAALADNVHVLNCEGGWNDCIHEANAICGSGGYTEVDRAEDWHITGAGRLNEQGTSGGNMAQRNARKEVYQRSMSIRCD